MDKRTKIAVAAAATVAAIGIAAGVGIAAGGDDEPLTGRAYDRATAAALAHTGEGRVTETEIGDDGAAYEVEIRLGDGTQVEVHLDDGFNVIGSEADDDGAGDEDADGTDD